MSNNYTIKSLVAKRVGGQDFDAPLNSYKFIKIKNAKKELLKEHSDTKIIDLGVGEPDIPADNRVVKRLHKEASKASNRFYADNGIASFKCAARDFLKQFYNINDIDENDEIIHGIGTKSMLSFLPHCFINQGDYTLTTVPGYPIIATHTKYIGGNVHSMKLMKENNYYPLLNEIPATILEKAKILYINYPNNPTGQVATKEFYKEVIDFAKKNNLIVVSDAAYSPLVFDMEPTCFLQQDGAKDVGVEIYSLSKAFNMTGWRLAFMAGNKDIIKVYSKIKSQSDSGQFMAIQHAGIEALNNLDIIVDNCIRYERRHKLLVAALKEVGFEIEMPRGTFYLYTSIPKGTKNGITFKNAEEAANYILKNAYVSTVPWDDAGAYLRFSVTFEADSIEDEMQIIREVKERLLSLNLKF